MNTESPLIVSIKCLVYNHEPYLRQCLNGFVMQKTNFRFEAIVHDDASTDKSADIIREYAEKYPDIIKPVYETENQYSKHDGSLSRIMNSHLRGKYVAMCEGDDYWTDPLKLQKQVDFLEAHPDYGMVHSHAKIYNVTLERFEPSILGRGNNTFLSELCQNDIATLTVCIRKDLLLTYSHEIEPYSHEWKMGDYPLWLWAAANMNVGFLEDITAVYDKLLISASHSQDKNKQIDFEFNACLISFFFAEKFLQSNADWRVFVNKRFRACLRLILHYYAMNKLRDFVQLFNPYPKYLNFGYRKLLGVFRCILF